MKKYYSVLHAVVLLLLKLTHITTSTSGANTGDPTEIFQSFENVLSSELYDAVSTEVEAIHGHLERNSYGNAHLAHGKKQTFWFNLNDKPMSNIEKAIMQILKYSKPDIDPSVSVTGAEWWIQHKDPNEGIGFHYDKDEGMASTKARMRHPLRATVTYLCDYGAPTVILNMTTPDGNSDVPAIPTRVFVSFPTRNRHITFRWDTRPEEPYVAPLSADLRAAADKAVRGKARSSTATCSLDSATCDAHTDAGAVAESGAPSVVTQLSVTSVDNTIECEVRIPPGDLYYFYFPAGLALAANHGVFDLLYADHVPQGAVAVLDLFHTAQVNHLFSVPQPKVLVMLSSRDAALYRAALRAVLPLAKKYLGTLKVYLCPTDTCADAIASFGLSERDLPRVVVDDTATGGRYVHDRAGVDGAEVEGFLQDTLKAALGNDEERSS